jgi:hypothetical protein
MAFEYMIHFHLHGSQTLYCSSLCFHILRTPNPLDVAFAGADVDLRKHFRSSIDPIFFNLLSTRLRTHTNTLFVSSRSNSKHSNVTFYFPTNKFAIALEY